MVSAGEWRDYAIDFLDDCAVFSIYRHASEECRCSGWRNAGEAEGRSGGNIAGHCRHPSLVLKRGHELVNVLKVFERKLMKALAER